MCESETRAFIRFLRLVRNRSGSKSSLMTSRRLLTSRGYFAAEQRKYHGMKMHKNRSRGSVYMYVFISNAHERMHISLQSLSPIPPLSFLTPSRRSKLICRHTFILREERQVSRGLLVSFSTLPRLATHINSAYRIYVIHAWSNRE